MSNRIVDIDLDKDGEVIPQKHDKIALIDADTLIYTSCLNIQEENYIMPDDEIDELKEQGFVVDENKGIYFSIDIEEAFRRAEEKLETILEKTGCIMYELHFTGNQKNSFRYQFYKDYKANRRDFIPPAGLQQLKELFLERRNSFIHHKWEADDIVVYKKNKMPDNYILVAVDKDVLNTVEGKHFNYYESIKHNKKQKWVEVSAKQARMWPYYQCIIGDTSDNIIGPKGIGPKRALKFINEDMTEKELWAGVVKAYESKGLTEFDAIVNMNLVNMNLLADDEDGNIIIRKWYPDFDEEGNHVWK